MLLLLKGYPVTSWEESKFDCKYSKGIFSIATYSRFCPLIRNPYRKDSCIGKGCLGRDSTPVLVRMGLELFHNLVEAVPRPLQGSP